MAPHRHHRRGRRRPRCTARCLAPRRRRSRPAARHPPLRGRQGPGRDRPQHPDRSDLHHRRRPHRHPPGRRGRLPGPAMGAPVREVGLRPRPADRPTGSALCSASTRHLAPPPDVLAEAQRPNFRRQTCIHSLQSIAPAAATSSVTAVTPPPSTGPPAWRPPRARSRFLPPPAAAATTAAAADVDTPPSTPAAFSAVSAPPDPVSQPNSVFRLITPHACEGAPGCPRFRPAACSPARGSPSAPPPPASAHVSSRWSSASSASTTKKLCHPARPAVPRPHDHHHPPRTPLCLDRT